MLVYAVWKIAINDLKRIFATNVIPAWNQMDWLIDWFYAITDINISHEPTLHLIR